GRKLLVPRPSSQSRRGWPRWHGRRSEEEIARKLRLWRRERARARPFAIPSQLTTRLLVRRSGIRRASAAVWASAGSLPASHAGRTEVMSRSTVSKDPLSTGPATKPDTRVGLRTYHSPSRYPRTPRNFVCLIPLTRDLLKSTSRSRSRQFLQIRGALSWITPPVEMTHVRSSLTNRPSSVHTRT